MIRARSRSVAILTAMIGSALVVASTPAVQGSPDQSEPAPVPQYPIDGPAVTDSPSPIPAPMSDADFDGDNENAESEPESEETSDLARKARQAVANGLAYLAANQQANGSWLNDVGYKLNYSYMVTHRMGNHPGVTSIACLAFMAGGSYPGRGKYGDNVRRGLEFVLSSVSNEEGSTRGFITNGGSRMYSHAFATLFLAEVLGMSNFSAQDEQKVREALQRAVHLIVTSQNANGAWRYAPNATDSDISICVCQLQALRAARNVGITVPAQTISRAKEYIRNSYMPGGAFLYQTGQADGSRESWTLTAAGVCALQQAGSYDWFTDRNGNRRSLDDSIEYLERNRPYTPEWAARRPIPPFGYFYGHYYAAQAIYQYSRNHPQLWPAWLEDVRYKFVAMQQPDGCWSDEIGRNYATAMACLVLQIHQEYLPIFQK